MVWCIILAFPALGIQPRWGWVAGFDKLNRRNLWLRQAQTMQLQTPCE